MKVDVESCLSVLCITANFRDFQDDLSRPGSFKELIVFVEAMWAIYSRQRASCFGKKIFFPQTLFSVILSTNYVIPCVVIILWPDIHCDVTHPYLRQCTGGVVTQLNLTIFIFTK